MMFLLESSSSTSYSDLQSYIKEHNVTCSAFDKVDTSNVPENYEVSYFPIFYIIYPDRSYKSFSGGGGEAINYVMETAIAESPGLSTTTYDAKILEFESPIGSYNTDSIRPKLTIQNYGTETLTAVDIESIIDGNVIKTYNWTGSLEQYEIENIELENINNINAGKHTFTFNLKNPNGEIDEDPLNNNLDTQFFIIPNEAKLSVSITTDNYPEETTWAIINSIDTIASGGNFEIANHNYIEDVFVYADSCYSFIILDSENDGNSNKPAEIKLNGYVLAEISDFNDGSSASVDFCATIPPPTITFSPEDGATNVVQESNMKITFDMPVRLLNNNAIIDPALFITLRENNEKGEDVVISASINNDKTEISIIPDSYLKSEQTYILSIDYLVENEYDIAIDKDSVAFTTRTNTGIDKSVLNSSLKVYPNPVIDELNIDVNCKKHSYADISIYNQKGSLIKNIPGIEIYKNGVFSINTKNMS
ncbi:MAG: Ig-like domain-containing protein, partial [Bacteroidota bacterium]|nr:Ig-like domain-containing protein [Bacteroidota bacterium]